MKTVIDPEEQEWHRVILKLVKDFLEQGVKYISISDYGVMGSRAPIKRKIGRKSMIDDSC